MNLTRDRNLSVPSGGVSNGCEFSTGQKIQNKWAETVGLERVIIIREGHLGHFGLINLQTGIEE
jgi:hypothetical protein